jgi:hypothetical protein
VTSVLSQSLIICYVFITTMFLSMPGDKYALKEACVAAEKTASAVTPLRHPELHSQELTEAMQN